MRWQRIVLGSLAKIPIISTRRKEGMCQQRLTGVRLVRMVLGPSHLLQLDQQASVANRPSVNRPIPVRPTTPPLMPVVSQRIAWHKRLKRRSWAHQAFISTRSSSPSNIITIPMHSSSRMHKLVERQLPLQTAWWTKKTNLTMRGNQHRNQVRLVQIRCLLELLHRLQELTRPLRRLLFRTQIIVIITRESLVKSASPISLFLRGDVRPRLPLAKLALQVTSIWALHVVLSSRLRQLKAPTPSLMSATKCKGTQTVRRPLLRRETSNNNKTIHKLYSRKASESQISQLAQLELACIVRTTWVTTLQLALKDTIPHNRNRRLIRVSKPALTIHKH